MSVLDWICMYMQSFKRDSSDYLMWGCMRYLLMVIVLATVDGGWHTPGLENQRGAAAWKLSNVLLWTASITKGI